MGQILFEQVSIEGEPPSDLLISGEKIRAIGAEANRIAQLEQTDTERISARGLIALPGLVDLHTHLREPGDEASETVRSGTQAAALGGYTCVHAMANTTPCADRPEIVELVQRLGREAGWAEVRPVGAVTKNLAGTELADLEGMARSEAEVKVFSDDGMCVFDPLLMRQALERLKPFKALIAQHAQEPRLTQQAQMNESALSRELGLTGWPTVAEEMIIARDILLAQYLEVPVHICHVSSATAVELIRWAKAQGIPVSAEATPHHLYLSDQKARSLDPVYKVNPPLRAEDDRAALQQGLAEGTIDIVGTDHAPHCAEKKSCGWEAGAFGMIGLETALPIVHTLMVKTGRMTYHDLARVMSTRPAELGQVSGQGQPIALGQAANLCLFNPAEQFTVAAAQQHSSSKNTPFHGERLFGRVLYTCFRGTLTVREAQLAAPYRPVQS